MDLQVSFGAWVTRQRKALNLTREQLARRIGCSVPGLRKIESDERRPSRQMAELLADCLQIPLDQRPTFLRVARGQLHAGRLPATGFVPGVGGSRPAPAFLYGSLSSYLRVLTEAPEQAKEIKGTELWGSAASSAWAAWAGPANAERMRRLLRGSLLLE